MNSAILVINAGSSSIKFSGYSAQRAAPILIFKGEIEGIGSIPCMRAMDANGASIAEKRWSADARWNHETLFDYLFNWLETYLGGREVAGVGHRVVHGGSAFTAATRVSLEVLVTLQRLCPLAPLHQPHNLAAIRAVATVSPPVPQVACFDTAFHHTMPRVAQSFALPRGLSDAGVRRYGFHGLSYD